MNCYNFKLLLNKYLTRRLFIVIALKNMSNDLLELIKKINKAIRGNGVKQTNKEKGEKFYTLGCKTL